METLKAPVHARIVVSESFVSTFVIQYEPPLVHEVVRMFVFQQTEDKCGGLYQGLDIHLKQATTWSSSLFSPPHMHGPLSSLSSQPDKWEFFVSERCMAPSCIMSTDRVHTIPRTFAVSVLGASIEDALRATLAYFLQIDFAGTRRCPSRTDLL